MRKKSHPLLHVLILSGFAFLLNSCQKDTDDEIPGNTISSDNPVALSAALKVWHGQRTTGTAPASNGNIPALDPSVNPEVTAFAGRYAIIKPEVMAGEIAGYYVSIAGSGQYFKVDFNLPRNVAGRGLPRFRSQIFSRPQTGNADSSIVIVLPPNIQAPDTFCITYCAYDPSGNIGQPVTTCIIVNTLGGDANSAWLQNDWKVTSTWELINNQREYLDTVIYNKWAAAGGYECLMDSSGLSWLAWIGDDPGAIVSDSIYYRKLNLRFATNGAMDYKEDLDEKWIDQSTSTCTQFHFDFERWGDSLTGGWSFNSTTNKLLLIFEFDYLGYPEPEIWEYDVIKVNNNNWIMKDPWDDFYIRLER